MNDSEFLHGLGLDLLATGISTQPKVAALCLLADSETVSAIHKRFSLLVGRWVLTALRQNVLFLFFVWHQEVGYRRLFDSDPAGA
jgi:hypothetical protein